MSTYVPIIKFADQSPSFTYGFEAGALWQRLKNNPEILENECLREENLELYQDIAKYNKYEIIQDGEVIDGWVHLTFIKLPQSKLTLVKND